MPLFIGCAADEKLRRKKKTKIEKVFLTHFACIELAIFLLNLFHVIAQLSLDYLASGLGILKNIKWLNFGCFRKQTSSGKFQLAPLALILYI